MSAAPGWYPDPRDPAQQRYWSGSEWTTHVAATTPPPVPIASGPHVAVTRIPVETNHTFHLIMSIVTCGVWLPVWAIVAVYNAGRTRKQVTHS